MEMFMLGALFLMSQFIDGVNKNTDLMSLIQQKSPAIGVFFEITPTYDTKMQARPRYKFLKTVEKMDGATWFHAPVHAFNEGPDSTYRADKSKTIGDINFDAVFKFSDSYLDKFNKGQVKTTNYSKQLEEEQCLSRLREQTE